MALSANVLYEHKISRELITKVLSPLLEEEGYGITNYHIAKGVLVSMASNGVGHQPEEVLERAFKKSGDLCLKLKKEGKLNSDPIVHTFLSNYKLLGEYSEPGTAEKLFPALAVENGLKMAQERISDFEEQLKYFGNRLTNL